MNSQNFNSAEIGTGWDRLKCKNWQDYLLLWLPAVRKIPPSLQSTQYRISITNRRKFRSQTSDNMDRWKAEMGRVREKRRVEERRWQKRKSQKKEAQMREKVGKSRDTVFFQWFVAPEGRKVGSLKRRVRSHLARWEIKKCTPLWREAHFEVKVYKTHHSRITFGSCDVEKVHAVVSRSTFRSQNVKNTRGSDHFWRFKCRARRKGLCTLSRVGKTWGFCIIFNYNHHYATQRCNTLQLHLHYIPLHDATLHCITLNWTQLHSITLNYTTLHYTRFHYTPLHYTTLRHITLHYAPLHYTTFHSTPLHYTTLHYTNYNNPPFYYATLRYTNYTTLHKTSFHYTALHLQLQLQLQLHYISLH